MARAHSKTSRVMVNTAHLSGEITGYSLQHNRAYSSVTTLTDEGEKSIPGLLSGTLSLQAVFDSAAGLLFDVLHDPVTGVANTDDGLLVTVFPDAFTVGQPAFIAVSDVESVSVDAAVTDSVGMQVQGKPDDGIDWGVALHAHAAETADGSGASVNNGASTTGGGVASLHVSAFSGLTNAIIKIQDSADDAIWADLITFSTVTGLTHQRATVTGAVDQYVRATVDVTGTGSVTYTVAFARR